MRFVFIYLLFLLVRKLLEVTRETIMSQSSGTASGDAKLSWEPKRVCIVGSG